ncbi:hypothetical protein MMC20_001315 [Loxospora ochrophaea]|nr:hypothetical protein [Loxospora ochrophaea]
MSDEVVTVPLKILAAFEKLEFRKSLRRTCDPETIHHNLYLDIKAFHDDPEYECYHLLKWEGNSQVINRQTWRFLEQERIQAQQRRNMRKKPRPKPRSKIDDGPVSELSDSSFRDDANESPGLTNNDATEPANFPLIEEKKVAPFSTQRPDFKDKNIGPLMLQLRETRKTRHFPQSLRIALSEYFATGYELDSTSISGLDWTERVQRFQRYILSD